VYFDSGALPIRQWTICQVRTKVRVVDIGKRAVRDFGKRLREVRLARGFTQEQLAAELELDTTFISRIETGKRSPSLPNIARIASVLDVPIASMFDRGSF